MMNATINKSFRLDLARDLYRLFTINLSTYFLPSPHRTSNGWLEARKIVISYRVFLTIAIVYSLTLVVLLFFRPSDQRYHQYNVIPFATIWQYLFSTQNLLVAT